MGSCNYTINTGSARNKNKIDNRTTQIKNMELKICVFAKSKYDDTMKAKKENNDNWKILYNEYIQYKNTLLIEFNITNERFTNIITGVEKL